MVLTFLRPADYYRLSPRLSLVGCDRATDKKAGQ